MSTTASKKKTRPSKKPASKKTRLPDGCDLCSDGGDHHVLHLHAKCHLHAPLRLTYRGIGEGQGVIGISCYVPDCARHVATFSVSGVIKLKPLCPRTCELCNDNDARRFRDRGIVDFTAPFRLECHRTVDGSRVLGIYCYVEECNQLFALLALSEIAS